MSNTNTYYVVSSAEWDAYVEPDKDKKTPNTLKGTCRYNEISEKYIVKSYMGAEIAFLDEVTLKKTQEEILVIIGEPGWMGEVL